MTTYSYNPQPELEFITEGGMHFTSLADVYSYQSQRSLDNPVAQATVTLQGNTFQGVSESYFKGKEVAKVLSPYDLCKVWLRDAKGKRWLDGLYLVNSLHPSLVEQNGIPTWTTQLQLKGIGTALVDYQIFWHPHIAARANLGGIGYLLRAKGKVPTGRPDQVLSSLFDAFLNDKYVFTLKDGRKLSQALNKNFATIPDGGALMGLAALGMEGALWQTLKRYSDAPWCELFVDVEQEHNNPVTQGVFGDIPAYQYGNREGLYLRPTPFNLSTWRELAREDSAWGFTYEDSERMGGGEQVARDLGGVYNFFWVPAKAVLSSFDQISNAYSKSGGKLPLYDEDSIRQHGLRRLEQGTEYVQYISSADGKNGVLTAAKKKQLATSKVRLTDLLVKRTTQLHQWFGYDGFFRGTITTRGRIGTDPQHGARIGSVLTRKRDGYQFYVTGIAQNWVMPGPHTTTWTVSRGHEPKKYLSWIQSHVGTVDQDGL